MCPCQRRCEFNAGCKCCFVVQKKDIFRSRRMKQHWDCFWKMWEIGRRWVMYICSCFKFCLQIMLITVAHPTSSSFLCISTSNERLVFILWQVLGKEAEKFGGDTLLNGQEKLSIIRQQMDGWTDNALKVFSRHRKEGANSHPDQEGMMTLNEASHIHHPHNHFNAPYNQIFHAL